MLSQLERVIAGRAVAVIAGWVLAIGSANGAPLRLGIGGGVTIPSDYEAQLPGPHVTVELRSEVLQHLDGFLTFDIHHNRVDQDELDRAQSGLYGGARSVFMTAVGLGSRLEDHLNLDAGLGVYCTHWADELRRYSPAGSGSYPFESGTHLFVQIALHVDIIETRPGNVFVKVRTMFGPASELRPQIVLFPITAGFRFQ